MANVTVKTLVNGSVGNKYSSGTTGVVWEELDTSVKFSVMANIADVKTSPFTVGGATWGYKDWGVDPPASVTVTSGELVFTGKSGLSATGGIGLSPKNTGIVYCSIDDLLGATWDKGETSIAVIAHIRQGAPHTRINCGGILGLFTQRNLTHTDGWSQWAMFYYYDGTTHNTIYEKTLSTADHNAHNTIGVTRREAMMMVITGGYVQFFSQQTYSDDLDPSDANWIENPVGYTLNPQNADSSGSRDINGDSVIAVSIWQPRSADSGTPDPATVSVGAIRLFKRGL